jgi:hypothetical protein
LAHIVPSSLHWTLVTVPEVVQVKRAEVLAVGSVGAEVIVTDGTAGGRGLLLEVGLEAMTASTC